MKTYAGLRYLLSDRLGSIKERCKYPSCYGYKYYGGKGIKCLLSLDDLEFLWHRDYAASMKSPSIDRIDSNGHYEISNCRFLEFSDNRARSSKKERYSQNNPCKVIAFSVPEKLYKSIRRFNEDMEDALKKKIGVSSIVAICIEQFLKNDLKKEIVVKSLISKK